MSLGPKEKRITKTVLLSREDKLPFISCFKESTAAKTPIIENIPIVTPSKDKNVRNLLLRSALIANARLSLRTLRYISIHTFLQ